MNNQGPLQKIQRALFSLSDKKGGAEFATFLHTTFNVEILSTGGTATMLREAGIPVTDVPDYTGFPECFDGRVKTLHPLIHGGLLYVRKNPDHVEMAQKLGIKPIDLVVVNLYPFEKTAAKPDVTFEEVIENIDIGGPGMLRSAAKNHESVAAVCNPNHYSLIKEQMIANDGAIDLKLRRFLAKTVFQHTGAYDTAIGNYLESHQEVA